MSEPPCAEYDMDDLEHDWFPALVDERSHDSFVQWRCRNCAAVREARYPFGREGGQDPDAEEW